MSEVSKLEGVQNFLLALFNKEDNITCKNIYFLSMLLKKAISILNGKYLQAFLFFLHWPTYVKKLLTIDNKKLKFWLLNPFPN